MTSIVAPATDVRRESRYRARHVLWNLSTLKRVRHCGRYARSDAGVGVKVVAAAPGKDRSAGFSNVQTCGSVWSCPRCSAKIAAGRQADIEAALTEWGRRGGKVALLTLTMRHRKGQALADLWDGVSLGWQRATGGAGWKADQMFYGVPMARTIRSGKRAGEVVHDPRIRTIRVVEVTDGRAGWHVHIHALLLLADNADQDSALMVGTAMFDRWRSALVGAGFDAPTDAHGVKVDLLAGDPAKALGDYFTKSVYSPEAKAALETARGDLKDAKGGNRTPFAILKGLVEVHATGDLAGREGLPEVSQDEARWAEWESASKGRRQVAWTAGLRDELLPDTEEKSDEELAEEDHGGETIGRIEPAVWKHITATRSDWTVLAAFNVSDADGWAEVWKHAAAVAAGDTESQRARRRALLQSPIERARAAARAALGLRRR